MAELGSELEGIVGYHNVSAAKCGELLLPYMSKNGSYLLRPSAGKQEGVICIITVIKDFKMFNCRVYVDRHGHGYFVNESIQFTTIQGLISYYSSNCLDPPGIQLVTPVVMKPLSEQRQHHSLSSQDIPGWHQNLTNQFMKTAMEPYLGEDGWFLLRPSSTRLCLALSVTHSGQIVNFKLCHNGEEYYISPKTRFTTIQALISYYSINGIHSNSYKQIIPLERPIPVDPDLDAKLVKQMPPLPFPWQEYYNEQYKRHYYYNPDTGANTWERPQAHLSDERAQQIIEMALESSKLDMRNVIAVITGLMGSGKTWLLSRLFSQLPPDLYTSTGVAEQSFRGLLHHLINVTSSTWEPFSHGKILELLACLFHMASQEKLEVAAPRTSSAPSADDSSSTTHPPADDSSSTTHPPADDSSSTTHPSLSTHCTSLESDYSFPPESPPVSKSSTMKSMVRLVKTSKESKSAEMLELIHMIDTGGQPELLENLPSLIHHSHLVLLVLNLMFGLDEHPCIDFHEEGRAYKRVLPSQYSNRQIIQKLASTLQAKRFSQKEGQSFRLLVVATHRDCVPEGELQAKVKVFDQGLKDILLPSNNKELIRFSANQIPFVLNLKDPDNDDEDMLELIRSEISKNKVGEIIKTPGSFLVFEQVLIEFANLKVKRDVLSLSECVEIGTSLKMTPDEVEAALIFFHRQLTLLYFRHILPDIVFTRPQTPLDCINTVVKFSYKVESGEVKGITDELVSSLRDGIITEEILSHKQLTQCFIPGLYEPCDAVDLLCHTLTLAPLSREVQSTPDTSDTGQATSQPTPTIEREKREYLMMSLRSAIPDKEVPQHLPPPSEIAPLVVQFTKNCVPLSCFSRTISCLLAMYDWKLSRADDGSRQCLSHNVVSLYKPLTPGQIVLVDMGHSFQVHVNVNADTKPDTLSKMCFQFKETIFAAINQVFEVLELADIEVSPAFLCSCSRKPDTHTASAYQFESQWLLHCSMAEKNIGVAQNEQKVWLDAPVVEQEKPSLPKLLRLKLSQKVGVHYMQFGVLLLDDEDGSLVEAITHECLGRCDKIVHRILVEWVRGKGRAVTWKTLVDTLKDCDLTSLADHIMDTATKKI